MIEIRKQASVLLKLLGAVMSEFQLLYIFEYSIHEMALQIKFVNNSYVSTQSGPGVKFIGRISYDSVQNIMYKTLMIRFTRYTEIYIFCNKIHFLNIDSYFFDIKK